MVIVADGQDVADLVPDDERIRLIAISGSAEIGAKRNFACEHSRGEFVAHFDDDDYSAPDRLSDQIGRLLQTGKSVTGYNQMRFTDGRRCWTYHGTPLFALGTSLCYRRDWWQAHPFPSLQVGEDSAFVNAAGYDIAVADAGDLMYATIHGTNTSPRQTEANSSFRLTCSTEAQCTHRLAER